MRWFRAVVVTLLTALFGAAALAVATGAVASVATHGASMEPRFHTGDLAVVRTTEAYHVGDVVAYRSDMLDTVVMHRIVGVDGGRFTLQGDNNTWLDPERPTHDELIGKLAFRVPQGAVWLGRLISPVALGLMAFGVLAAGGTAAQTRRRRRRRRTTVSQHVAQTRSKDRWMTGLPRWVTTAAASAAVVGVLGVALGVTAWTTPGALVDGTSQAESGQTMAFSYTAEVGRSPAYDDTVVTAPEPVFRRLADTVEVQYSYKGDPGIISVHAELSTASGWHSTVPLGSVETFDEGAYTGRVSVDLKALERRAQAAAAATGIPATQVDVAIIPTVTTPDDQTFAPKLKLALTPLQLQLPGGASSLAVGQSSPATTGSSVVPHLSLAGRELPVSSARTLSVLLALGALLLAAAVGLIARISRPATEAAAIRRRYAQILVEVEPMSTPSGRPTVDVVDFATLAKLAGRYELLVLHWSRSGVETFLLQDQGTTYRYRTGSPEARSAVGIPVAAT
jgi:signal peptidase I